MGLGDTFTKVLKKAAKEGKAGNVLTALLALCFGLDFAYHVNEKLDLYSKARPIRRWINKDSFLFHAVEIDVDKTINVPVNDGHGNMVKGMWLNEAMMFQCHPEHDAGSDHDPEYPIVWSAQYTAVGWI
jgi:hypothetical protein